MSLACPAIAQNQTDTLSPISSGGVPFDIQIQQAEFSLPVGLQSFVVGTYKGKWLLLAGRVNGLHGFNNDDNNFPPDTQNTTVFVVDPVAQTVVTKSLTNSDSGLTQAQIDSLSATGSQSFQSGNKLYVAGGYGFDTATNDFTTKDTLSAIDISGLMHWVTNPNNGETAAQHIRQIFDPMFRVTGGAMMEDKLSSFKELHYAMLAFGQDVEGPVTFSSSPTYTGQVRRFYIIDDGKHLRAFPLKSAPKNAAADLERTDLNVVPIIESTHNVFSEGFLALSGVFTPGFGIWTVPVEINRFGIPHMANPDAAKTFKQGMNNFVCPTLEMFSLKQRASFTVLMGGISYGFFDDGGFETDAELPFINQVTTIKRDNNGNFSQHLMDGEYPVILSEGSNPGNQLLFDAGAVFIPAKGIPMFENGVLKYDQVSKHTVVVGYIVGGIQSTLPNTNKSSDTAASPYIFTVTLVPNP